MIKKTTLFIFFAVPILSTAQKLDRSTKKQLKLQLDTMLERDQKYRTQLQFAETNSKKIDSIIHLSPSGLDEYMKKRNRGEIKLSKETSGSLEKMQNALDSSNANDFEELILKYGYPSKKRIGSNGSLTLCVHLVNTRYFERFFPLFGAELAKGNMPAEEYAYWYDKYWILQTKKHFSELGARVFPFRKAWKKQI